MVVNEWILRASWWSYITMRQIQAQQKIWITMSQHMIDSIGVSFLYQLILVFASHCPSLVHPGRAVLSSLLLLLSSMLSPQHWYSWAVQLFVHSYHCLLYSPHSMTLRSSIGWPWRCGACDGCVALNCVKCPVCSNKSHLVAKVCSNNTAW